MLIREYFGEERYKELKGSKIDLYKIQVNPELISEYSDDIIKFQMLKSIAEDTYRVISMELLYKYLKDKNATDEIFDKLLLNLILDRASSTKIVNKSFLRLIQKLFTEEYFMKIIKQIYDTSNENRKNIIRQNFLVYNLIICSYVDNELFNNIKRLEDVYIIYDLDPINQGFDKYLAGTFIDNIPLIFNNISKETIELTKDLYHARWIETSASILPIMLSLCFSNNNKEFSKEEYKLLVNSVLLRYTDEVQTDAIISIMRFVTKIGSNEKDFKFFITFLEEAVLSLFINIDKTEFKKFKKIIESIQEEDNIVSEVLINRLVESENKELSKYMINFLI